VSSNVVVIAYRSTSCLANGTLLTLLASTYPTESHVLNDQAL